MIFTGLLLVAGRLWSRLTMCFVEQVGDGTTIKPLTPTAVVGLGSGVAMVALGAVGLIATAAWLLLVCCERCRCVLDSLECCEETRDVVT